MCVIMIICIILTGFLLLFIFYVHLLHQDRSLIDSGIKASCELFSKEDLTVSCFSVLQLYDHIYVLDKFGKVIENKYMIDVYN